VNICSLILQVIPGPSAKSILGEIHHENLTREVVMSLSLKESLDKLERLSPRRLDQTSRRIRTELGGAEWKMGLCLLASVRRRSFRTLGYSTISEYAEKALHLSGKKVSCLLGAAKALEHLPLLSEAFRNGQIGWGKLRAIQGLVTPETEQQWLTYALNHRTDQVVHKAATSPTAGNAIKRSNRHWRATRYPPPNP
jgi:hypothetical protein